MLFFISLWLLSVVTQRTQSADVYGWGCKQGETTFRWCRCNGESVDCCKYQLCGSDASMKPERGGITCTAGTLDSTLFNRVRNAPGGWGQAVPSMSTPGVSDSLWGEKCQFNKKDTANVFNQAAGTVGSGNGQKRAGEAATGAGGALQQGPSKGQPVATVDGAQSGSGQVLAASKPGATDGTGKSNGNAVINGGGGNNGSDSDKLKDDGNVDGPTNDTGSEEDAPTGGKSSETQSTDGVPGTSPAAETSSGEGTKAVSTAGVTKPERPVTVTGQDSAPTVWVRALVFVLML